MGPSLFAACSCITLGFHKPSELCLPIVHRSEEANKAFSAAVQMHDVLVKAWAMWGDYLENIFVKERQLHLGVSAITCYLHACRHQNESKSRKYLAKVSHGQMAVWAWPGFSLAHKFIPWDGDGSGKDLETFDTFLNGLETSALVSR